MFKSLIITASLLATASGGAYLINEVIPTASNNVADTSIISTLNQAIIYSNLDEPNYLQKAIDQLQDSRYMEVYNNGVKYQTDAICKIGTLVDDKINISVC